MKIYKESFKYTVDSTLSYKHKCVYYRLERCWLEQPNDKDS